MKHEEISLNTKRSLAEALKTAMRDKPFQKISISEIIKGANVNRKTFYYHFEDTYALLKWMLEEEAINVVKHFDLLVDFEEAIGFVMDYVEENDYIINCAYDSIGRDELKRFFFTDFHEIVVSVIDNAEEKMGIELDLSYKEFLTQFYMEAFTGMIMDWAKDRKERDRDRIIQYLSQTIQKSLKGVLEAFKENE